jgi:acylphosphatase
VRKADFNFYAQIAAHRFGINAVYKNGDTRHVDLEIEGDEDAVQNFVHFMRSGPLQAYIEKFRMETVTFVNIRGFTSPGYTKTKEI